MQQQPQQQQQPRGHQQQPPPPHFGLGPPPPPAAEAAQRQPSPFQTPDCTTRTLAFDSAVSTATDEAQQRARKRKRRIDEAAAFITTRRRGRRTRGGDSDDSSSGSEEEQLPGHEHSEEKHDPSTRMATMYATGRRALDPALDGSKAGGVVRSATVSGRSENNIEHVREGMSKTPGLFASAKVTKERATPEKLEPPESHGEPKELVMKLRRLVRSCSARHHASSALFYADKLVRCMT
jgi:hypothetical protein